MFYITDYSKRITKNIVWITGPARSGTSLFGKLISSMKDVEYFFEPELLYSLVPLIKKISFKEWNCIFETYISEDLFYNHFIGRKLNFRKSDDSYVLNSVNNIELKNKLTNTLAQRDIKKILKKKKIKVIIKIPSLVEDLSHLKKKIKTNKFICTDRNSFSILNSLIKKKWFNQKNLINNDFPLQKINNYLYPMWLPKKYFKLWKTLNFEERSAIYIVIQKKSIKKLKPNYLIKYEDLLLNPKTQLENVCQKFNFNFTKKTSTLIKLINNEKLYTNTRLQYNIRESLIKDLSNI